jgi:hypothetical protein
MVLNGSQLLASVRDAVVFVHSNLNEVGRITRVHGRDRVSVILFKTVTEELLLQYALSIITLADFHFAVKSGMVELIETTEVWKIPRSTITDLAFLIPLHEAESGIFRLPGARKTYFIRYKCNGDGIVHDYQYSMLQATVAEPLAHRIFKCLYKLSSLVKKLLYHQPEEQTMRSAHLSMSYDSFDYLWSKLSNNEHIILNQFE